jgi:hypothetical protein
MSVCHCEIDLLWLIRFFKYLLQYIHKIHLCRPIDYIHESDHVFCDTFQCARIH